MIEGAEQLLHPVQRVLSFLGDIEYASARRGSDLPGQASAIGRPTTSTSSSSGASSR